MFGLLKKKAVNHGIYTPATGHFVLMEDVPDPVFSEKMMGEGFAVKPTEPVIYSPVCGVITSIFSTKHALGIETPSGKNVIVHMGIDTVELEGRPFTIHVKKGQKVTQETKIATLNLAVLAEAGKEDIIIIAFPEVPAGALILEASAHVTPHMQIGKLI